MMKVEATLILFLYLVLLELSVQPSLTAHSSPSPLTRGWSRSRPDWSQIARLGATTDETWRASASHTGLL